MSDTLAQLQTALAPKTGLHPIPLASETYELSSTASSEQLVNWFAEKSPPGGRSPFILKPTPGLTSFDTLGSGPILALEALAAPSFGPHYRTGTYWAISGTNAYVRREDLGGATNLGSVGTVTSGSGGGLPGLQPADYNAVQIAIGLNAVLFCVPPEVYVTPIPIGGGVVQLIAGVNNYPGGASSIAYLDGYYVFLSFSGETIFVSNLLDPTHFTALAFAQISAYADYGDRLFVHNSQLWVFGQRAAQPWYDTGDPTFPFAPVPGSQVPYGLGSQRSIVEIDNSLIFLANDGCVYQIHGYIATKISSPAVEEKLSGYRGGYLRDITACGFSFEGHKFYALTLPATGYTLVYDCEIKLWHERSTANSVWMVASATHLDGRVILGDRSNGNLYHMDSANPLENGVAMTRRAALPALVTHGPRGFMNRVEIEMSVGVDGGTVSLDWSDDGGVSYRTPARVLSLGAAGATRKRVVATRLGSFYTRNLRLQTTGGNPSVYAVDCDVPPRLP